MAEREDVITEDVIPIAKKYFDLVKAGNFPMQIDKAYLFGSYAKGTPHKDSDIDVAFVINNWTGGYADTVIPIWRLRESIDLRLEPHLIDPAEDYSNFMLELERTGILI